jgi:ligand-binding sensor domain-containing protein
MRGIFLLLFFVIIGGVVSAQNPDLVFHHITEHEGLSNNIVNCFLKDSRGFLWIGTYNGLNRYDGSSFTIFKQGKDSSTLADNTVHALCEDTNGNIWGTNERGIFCYVIKDNRFRNYFIPKKEDIPSIHNILCDRKGEIWAGGYSGLFRYDSSKDRLVECGNPSYLKRSAYEKRVTKNGMIEDPSRNGIWLATPRGLKYFTKATQEYCDFSTPGAGDLFKDHFITALNKSPDGHFWFFDNVSRQAIGFDPVTRKILIEISLGDKYKNFFGSTIFEDNEHNIWLSSWSYEILKISYKGPLRIELVRHSPSDRTTIAGDFFWAAWQDSENTIWLGTVGGISKINLRQLFYKKHDLFEKIFPGKKGIQFNTLAEDESDRSWWIGFEYDNRLLHYFPETGSFVFYGLPVKTTGQPEGIYSIKNIQKDLLITAASGTWIFDPRLKKFNRFNSGFAAIDTFKYSRVSKTNDTSYWFYNPSSLLNWNPVDHGFRRFTVDEQKNNQEGNIRCVRSAGKGAVWMALRYTDLGFTTTKSDHITQISLDESDMGYQSGYIWDLCVDRGGIVWLANKGRGLISFNPFNKKVKIWDESKGLAFNHIQAVMADAENRIWTAAYNKISVLNPVKGNFFNLSLPFTTNFYDYRNVMISLANGHIITNMNGLLFEFFPDRLNTKPIFSTPLISSINDGSSEILVSGNNEFTFASDRRFLAVNFGMLSDQENFPYSFEYKMEGLSDQWIDAGKASQALFAHLSSGRYTFRIKAVAKDRSWQSKETSLLVIIKTPFFRQVWFLSLVSILFISAIYLFFRFRIRHKEKLMMLENKAQLLEKEKTLVLYESLKQQLNPHFLFNSLTSLSGLIESDQKLAGKFLDQMSRIYRYLLKNRNSDVVTLREEIDFVWMYINIQQTRFKNGLKVSVRVEDENMYSKIAPVTLQNMLENAIKHNICNPDSPLYIDIYTEKDYIIIRNNIQRKKVVETSNKQGLQNFKSLYKIISNNPIVILEDEEYFYVKIPLV